MNNHEELQLRDRDIIPTIEVIEQILTSSYTPYEVFQSALHDLNMEQNWMWYTPHKVWCAKGQYFWTTIRGTKKNKVLYWLYVCKGYFYVTVWFKEKNRKEVLKFDVNSKTKQIINNAKTVMDSTFPVSFKVTNEESLTDIYKLIECKKKLEC
jgi:hypothetical protein